MFNKIKYTGFIISVFLLMGFVKKDTDIYFKISKSIDLFGKVYREIALNYVDNIDPEEFMKAGINGMLSSLDPYTVFLGEGQQKDIDLITKGKYGGIGVTVGLQNDKIIIVDLIEGYSAQRQGMRIGDVIVKIDSINMSKENYFDLGLLLKKEPGSEIKVSVKRDGDEEEIIFNLISEQIEIKNLSYYGFIPSNSNNVYLKLSGFTQSAGEEIKKAILQLKKEKEIRSIILDLRGNPGGLLDAAIDVCEKFIPKGDLVVSVAGRNPENIKNYYSREEPVAGDPKLVLLIDGGSASASEIVAGTIQDHDRGLIVGTHSFGKGLVQTVIPLSFDNSLKITTAKYFTPSGRCIQKIDYSYNNDVLEPSMEIKEEEYETDNLRKVYSRGGIKPDTLVSNDSESEQVKNLLARGVFFRFATHYFNRNNNVNFSQLPDTDIMNNFIQYLDEQDYEYISNSEKLLEKLLVSTRQGNDVALSDKINDLIEDFRVKKNAELKDYSSDIVSLIRQELAARVNGRDGRIEESLKNDEQFNTAYQLFQQDAFYNKLLHNGK